jgi:16S rRNA A1518/A1519 N6-dimethyltransferase RsmA/KsgA/DIM1 with predicted DNA glycosylase/AP lyase activity
MEFGVVAILLCESLLVIFGLYLIWSWITQTPFYPSKTKPLNDLLKNIELNKNVKFIDIGSGDGRIVVWAARQGFESHGIEFNPFLSIFSGVKNKAKIFNKDFSKHDFSNYNFAYLYIFPEHMDKVSTKLFQEMGAGSVIVTNTFKFSNISPDKVVDRYSIYYVK